jgi:hypothetical protein
MKQLTITALVALLSVMVLECQQGNHATAADRQKVAALNDALKSGLITQDEYDAKMSALGGRSAAQPASNPPGELRPFPIMDPVLRMQAWTLMAPANWTVDGTMLPGSSCVSGTTPLYRAFSPDEQAGVYVLPRVDWAWGPGVRASGDCLPWQSKVSAEDFLTYFIASHKLGLVRALSVPELEQARRNAFSQPGFTTSIDMARDLVRYSINGRDTEEWVSATVQCIDKAAMGVGEQHNCSAFVTRWFAPLGSLQAMLPTFDAMKMTLNQQWMAAWNAMMQGNINTMYGKQTQALLEQGRLAQAQRMRAHQDFMAGMEAVRENRDIQFHQHMYDKQKQNEDFVDYVLDCQRLYSSNPSEVSRLSVGGNCPNRQTW